jgi:rSAM/selenodomain-associated transferase 1
VKTRLIPGLGAAGAAELYRVLAEDVVARIRPRAREYERLFFFTPDDARPEMEAWFPGETWVAQEGTDLGARMSAAFDEAFRRGARRAAIIGSDVPGLSRDDVAAAFASLDDHDLVLGPARDGGYYLIALERPRPGLFRGIAWSTHSVFAATMERAAGLGLAVRALEPRRDIDTLDDVRAEWERIRPLLDDGLAEAVQRVRPC